MDFDVAVVGGGVLGTSLAYWLAARYDGTIAVLEREDRVAAHTSRRNTGVVHRPFYLHPEERKRFARAAQASFPLWKAYASRHDLPWAEVGTLKVAMKPHEVQTLERNARWAEANGMEPWEVEVLDGADVARLEPNVRCTAALHAKTDTAVDYGTFTEAVRRDAEALGASFLTRYAVGGLVAEPHRVRIHANGHRPPVRARLLVNCAGGEAVRVAHMLGVGTDYADLYFRGEYWTVADDAADLVRRNVYTVPRQTDLPFLDPHWIVRVDGSRDIGPNAVPVPSPYAYDGLLRHLPDWPAKGLEAPVAAKVRLALSRQFLGLAVRELLSSVSKGEMLRRVQGYIPKLREGDLVARGFAGVRANVVNRRGTMEKEAIEVEGPHSFHVLNYNSPGATGAPAYTAYLVDRLARGGHLDHLRANPKEGPWRWADVAEAMDLTR